MQLTWTNTAKVLAMYIIVRNFNEKMGPFCNFNNYRFDKE